VFLLANMVNMTYKFGGVPQRVNSRFGVHTTVKKIFKREREVSALTLIRGNCCGR
jgi:hypothetical protein